MKDVRCKDVLAVGCVNIVSCVQFCNTRHSQIIAAVIRDCVAKQVHAITSKGNRKKTPLPRPIFPLSSLPCTPLV